MHKCAVFFFSFYDIKIKRRIIKQQQTHNWNKRFTKLSCWSDKVLDKTDWVSGFRKYTSLPKSVTELKTIHINHIRKRPKACTVLEAMKKLLVHSVQKIHHQSHIRCKCVSPRLYLHPNKN